MDWKIDFKHSASEALFKFPKNIQLSISRAIRERLASNPHSYKMLNGGLKGCRRMRVGSYRIVYIIDESKEKIEIIAIGVRSKVYR